MKSILRSPFVSAACGGIAVAGVFLALGVTGRRTITTVIEESPLTAERASDAGAGLTPYEIYQRDAPSVVFVRAAVDPPVAGPFVPAAGAQSGWSTGSGFVVDRQGDILTNYHVIAGAESGAVSVELQHGVTVSAQIVGQDATDDLAMLRIDARAVNLAPLTLANSATARVGDPTLAIGNPFGLDRTLSTGIVSALQRQITAPDGFAIDNVIQTDAPLDPGASGGPVIDAAGQVIGISSQIQTGAGSLPISFAVPSNTARALLVRMAETSSPAYLGIAGVTVDGPLATALRIQTQHGVLVQSVNPSGPAAKVGLRAGRVKKVLHGQPVVMGGDVIERIDGGPADSVGALTKAIASKRPGQTVEIVYLRAGKLQSVQVTLGSGPAGG
jgi:S1-C subfamily serine protease